MISCCLGHCRRPTQKQRFGITVCPEWRGEEGFQNFKSWALSHGFHPDLCLDRIDTFKDYGPSNCRYVTQKENNRNKRNTVYITFQGEKIPLSKFCEDHGLSYGKAYHWNKKGKRPEFLLERCSA